MSGHRCGFLPWWFCCCWWCSCGSPGSSSSPSSASLWPVAVSSARRFATSCFAHWIAPSIRCASCLFSSIILRIFACGENPQNPRSVSYRLLHHKHTKIPFCPCALFYKLRKSPKIQKVRTDIQSPILFSVWTWLSERKINRDFGENKTACFTKRIFPPRALVERVERTRDSKRLFKRTVPSEEERRRAPI